MRPGPRVGQGECDRGSVSAADAFTAPSMTRGCHDERASDGARSASGCRVARRAEQRRGGCRGRCRSGGSPPAGTSTACVYGPAGAVARALGGRVGSRHGSMSAAETNEPSAAKNAMLSGIGVSRIQKLPVVGSSQTEHHPVGAAEVGDAHQPLGPLLGRVGHPQAHVADRAVGRGDHGRRRGRTRPARHRRRRRRRWSRRHGRRSRRRRGRRSPCTVVVAGAATADAGARSTVAPSSWCSARRRHARRQRDHGEPPSTTSRHDIAATVGVASPVPATDRRARAAAPRRGALRRAPPVRHAGGVGHARPRGHARRGRAVVLLVLHPLPARAGRGC